MKKTLQAVRGMPDMLPNDSAALAHIEQVWQEISLQYAYQQIRLPIVEEYALYQHTVGLESDIVQKEMFTLKGEQDKALLCLRPEGTAGCVRAALQHGLLHHSRPNYYYLGPMFRYERPQKGRYRQFTQIGVESFGYPGPDIEVEHICMVLAFWQKLKLDGVVSLEINSLGSTTARSAYRLALVDYFKQDETLLDEDSKRRLHTNPLRILDSKNPSLQNLIAKAPNLQQFLEPESLEKYQGFKKLLDELNIKYLENPRLVRGLDYYNGIVYEWKTDKIGAQSAICAGGRFDQLVLDLGGKATPAVGFAIGLERIMVLLAELNIHFEQALDVYLIVQGTAKSKQFNIAKQLRCQLPGLRIKHGLASASTLAGLKEANKLKASWAFIINDEQWQLGTIAIKNLTNNLPQFEVKLDEIELQTLQGAQA